jgi:hypothetical protein
MFRSTLDYSAPDSIILLQSLSPQTTEVTSQVLIMELDHLVERIGRGTITELEIDYLIFTSRERFIPFLEVLQSSTTIETVKCPAYCQLGITITLPKWVALVGAIGRIRTLSRLTLRCDCENLGARYTGSRLTEVAAALQGATNLRELSLFNTVPFMPLDGIQALAHALEQLPALQKFVWRDTCRVNRRYNLDPVINTLVNRCPQLRHVDITTRVASDEAMASLLQVGGQEPSTSLRLVMYTDQWAAVTGGIAACLCHVRSLTLVVSGHEPRDDAFLDSLRQDSINWVPNTVTTLARAIQRADSQHAGQGNPNLVYLRLEFPPFIPYPPISDAAGMELVEALTVNQILREFSLANATFRGGAYDAFGNMLRVRTELVVDLERLSINEAEPIANAYSRMMIVQRLNQAGRGRLLNQRTRQVMQNVLQELSRVTAADPPELHVSCINELLHDNPSLLCLI